MGYERRRDPRAIRRIVIGFGLGFLFAFGPIIPLLTVWDRSSPPPLPVVLAAVISMAVVAPILIFSAFSWALFFRCPQCRQRIKRLDRKPLPDGIGNSLRCACDHCNIEWNVFWQERAGDDEGA